MKKILLTFCIIISCAYPCEMALANTAASCPDKTLSTQPLKGKYIKDVLYEYVYHFLLQGQDKKIYDISIGQDTIAEFEGIEPGNPMTIPVSKKQRFDSAHATCQEYYEFTPTPAETGSYASGKIEIIDSRVTVALYRNLCAIKKSWIASSLRSSQWLGITTKVIASEAKQSMYFNVFWNCAEVSF